MNLKLIRDIGKVDGYYNFPSRIHLFSGHRGKNAYRRGVKVGNLKRKKEAHDELVANTIMQIGAAPMASETNRLSS